MLGPGGFSSARDIAAITVNRWSHGYGYVENSLFDGDDDKIAARARAGRSPAASPSPIPTPAGRLCASRDRPGRARGARAGGVRSSAPVMCERSGRMRRTSLHLVGVGVCSSRSCTRNGTCPRSLRRVRRRRYFGNPGVAYRIYRRRNPLSARTPLLAGRPESRVLVAAAVETAWVALVLAIYESPAAITAASIWLFSFWLLAPFVLLVLSCASLLVRHYSKRAV